MSKLITLDEFRAGARENAAFSGTVRLLATDESTPVEGKARTRTFCFSDASEDRAGDTINAKGWQTANFLRNPVALWAHDSSSPPVGRASNVNVVNKRLMGDIEFAPPETYAFADTVFRLVEGGFVRAVSVGFKPLEWNFSSDKERPFGIDFEEQELLEISLCPVPCNANALIEARAKGIDTRPLLEWAERILDGDGGEVRMSRQTLEDIFKATNTPHSARTRYRALTEKNDMADWKCSAARNLPVEDSDTWNGPAAEKSIFEWAGGDDFDPSKACKGFLFYDASKPKERGSYKDPIAHAVGGELKVPSGAIRAAASRLPQTDIPDAVKNEGEAILASYKEKAGIKAAGEDANAGGAALVGNCGRKKEEECGMKDPAECAMHVPASKSKFTSANCGREKSETCGLKDPQECSVHASFGNCGRDQDEACGMTDASRCAIHSEKSKTFKSGRTISAKTRASLEDAITHHDAATKCIKAVLGNDDPDDDDEPADSEPGPAAEDIDESLSPAQRRLKEARALKTSLTST